MDKENFFEKNQNEPKTFIRAKKNPEDTPTSTPDVIAPKISGMFSSIEIRIKNIIFITKINIT